MKAPQKGTSRLSIFPNPTEDSRCKGLYLVEAPCSGPLLGDLGEVTCHPELQFSCLFSGDHVSTFGADAEIR